VDEVLAVGDAEFQKKALGKMKDVSGKEGRTVLFVSHNMQAMKSLCNRGMLLKNGNVSKIGSIDETIDSYLSFKEKSDLKNVYTGNGFIKRVSIKTESGYINYGDKVTFEMCFESLEGISNIVAGFVIKDIYETAITGFNNRHYLPGKLNENIIYSGRVEVEIPSFTIMPGDYSIDLYLGDSTNNLEKVENGIVFTVEESKVNNTATQLNFSINKIFIEEVNWKIFN
jgi:lipopolysaccharide transport system ATP-binding protein